MCIAEAETTDYTDRTDAQIKKEQMRFMKITQNVITITAACFFIICGSALAQNAENIADREVQRRQAAIPEGEAALARGKSAMRSRNYTVAFQEFKTAIAYLPDAVVSGRAHDEAADGVCKSGTILAEARIAQGDHAGAEAILSEILNRYDPNCRKAQELLANLRQPGYFNKTVDAGFVNKVEEVKRLLAEADGYYQSGQYDKAMKSYDRVLTLDPYNTAARRGQERVDNTKYQYGEEAYNETRARQMWKVEEAWQQPVRKYGAVGPVSGGPPRGDLHGTAQMTNRLNKIIIREVQFRDAPIRDAIDQIREAAADPENDPEARGVNIVLRLYQVGEVAPPSLPVLPPPTGTGTPVPGAAGQAPPVSAPAQAPPVGAPGGPTQAAAAPPPSMGREALITLDLKDVSLFDVLRYMADQARLKVKIEPNAVLLIPRTEQSNDLITKRYHVPPEFFGGPLDVGYYIGSNLTGNSGQGAGTVTGINEAPPVATNVIEKEAVSFQSASGVGTGAGATSASNLVQGTASTRQTLLNDRQLVGRADAKTMLQSMGVSFPPNASATFWPHSGTLIVRNTQDNLDMVDALVDQANASAPKQVAIESKFVEINQNNLKELGFDWLLGPFSTNGKVFGAGGTGGNGVPVDQANFPFVDNGVPIGQNPVTSGNRSGNFAISASALDALLVPGLGQVAGVAPSIFGVAGVFTNPQFQVVIRALNQKKGIDLLSAPSVTTKSGQRAIIEVIRELRYPRTYTPPQVPSISTSTSTIVGASTSVPVVVTPTTPQDWETRNTGVTLEVEPVVGGDATTIDLNLVPQVVEFEGFINYGSPINAVGVNTAAGISISQPVQLTPNIINQPVFSTRKVTTSVSVYDGQTVVLGGLMREDVQKTEDKVPIIGDIPLVGRAFRTNTEQHTKKNLVIFVTAKIITPAGLPLNEEEEEGLLPPELPEVPAYKK
jgi:general secretion pathway protein D